MTWTKELFKLWFDHVLEEQPQLCAVSMCVKYLLSLDPESTGWHYHENSTSKP